MRLALVISTLGPGGAERQLSGMANYWADKGWPVTLLTLSKTASGSFYNLHPAIRQRDLKLIGSANPAGTAIVRSLGVLRAIRREINHVRPDAVLSFIDQTNVLTLAAVRGLGIPVIVSERINIQYHRIGWRWRVLRGLLYPFASGVVVQCEDIRRRLPTGTRRRSVVIPNFVAVTDEVSRPPRPLRRRPGGVVASMGRLTHQKGFDLLIRAFAQLPPQFNAWFLDIWGEGPLREQLEKLARTEGVGDRVRFRGVSRHPAEEFSKADLFVLSSRYEGFPNVLLEAMSVGLPVISFDCPSGPRAIIRDGVDGLLVPPRDVEALARAIQRLMKNPEERLRLASRAVEVNQRFSLERVMSRWEALFASAS